MGEGLQRARTAAKASRDADVCPGSGDYPMENTVRSAGKGAAGWCRNCDSMQPVNHTGILRVHRKKG